MFNFPTAHGYTSFFFTVSIISAHMTSIPAPSKPVHLVNPPSCEREVKGYIDTIRRLEGSYDALKKGDTIRRLEGSHDALKKEFEGPPSADDITSTTDGIIISAHDNQSSLDLANPPSTSSVHVFDVPLVLASADTLLGYGYPISDFVTAGCEITPWPVQGWRKLVPGTGNEGGVVEDVFRMDRVGHVQYAHNVGLDRRYIIGWFGKDPALSAKLEHVEPSAHDLTSILTHEANYHPDGAQVFAAKSPNPQPFVLLLAKPGDDITPESFRAFLVDPSTGIIGVHVNPFVWHQPAFPAASSVGPVIMDNRQGKVHACVSVDFVAEFGCYLRVPLIL
jgi:ureidoglycolate lyase